MKVCVCRIHPSLRLNESDPDVTHPSTVEVKGPAPSLPVTSQVYISRHGPAGVSA